MSEQSVIDDPSRVDETIVDPIELAFRRLIKRHSSAEVAAIDALASPALVAVPEALRVPREQLVRRESMVALLADVDHPTMVRLWVRARARGAAVIPVRIDGTHERRGDLYMFDLRRRRGVMMAVFLETTSHDDHLPEATRLPAHPPRVGWATKDAGAIFLSADAALAEMLGRAPQEIVGRRSIELIHPHDHEVGIAGWMDMLGGSGSAQRVRLRHRHRDGSWVWLEVTNHNRLSDPEHLDVIAEMVDVSDEMAAQEAVRAREQLLAQLTDTVPVGLFHADTQGRLLYTNRCLHEMTGTAIAASVGQQFSNVVGEGRHLLDRAVRQAASGSAADTEVSVRDARGWLRHLVISVRPLTDEDGGVTGLTGCVEDVTDVVREMRDLEVKAARDSLTGCLNREATLAALQHVLDHGSVSQSHPDSGRRAGTAVIFVDLDGFKTVNDGLGHAAGDDMLVTVAQRIRSAVRSGDLLGRVGGDEFLVVCPDVTDPADALDLARSLGQRVCRPLAEDRSGEALLRASMGVAWSDRPGLAPTSLIQAADAAMYESKRAGGKEPVIASVVGV